MSTAKIEPPKELFSYQWYDKESFGMTMLSGDLFYRVDSLRSKLEKLEFGLKKMDDMKDEPHILYKVEWIEANIGVWITIKHGDECNNALLIYPKKKRSTGGWNENMFGKEKKEGNYLVMLSNEAVDWLNAVNEYCNDMEEWARETYIRG